MTLKLKITGSGNFDRVNAPALDCAEGKWAEAARGSPVAVVQPPFTLRAGEPVTIKGTHGAFLHIANRQGREGWVSRETVAPVVTLARAG